jgi:hypothetical protein
MPEQFRSTKMETDMQVVREYAHKEHGSIGRIVLETDASVIKLNGKPIPEGSMEYLLTFALQAFQDAYAGAKNKDEAQSGFDKRFQRVLEGKIGVREGGGVTEEVRIARRVMRLVYKTKLDKDAWQVFVDLPEGEQNAKLDDLLVKNEAKMKPLVAEALEEARKERERKAKLGKGFDLDI